VDCLLIPAARFSLLVWEAGLEPATSRVQGGQTTIVIFPGIRHWAQPFYWRDSSTDAHRFSVLVEVV